MIRVVVRELYGNLKSHEFCYDRENDPTVADVKRDLLTRGLVTCGDNLKILLSGRLLDEAQVLCNFISPADNAAVVMHAMISDSQPILVFSSPRSQGQSRYFPSSASSSSSSSSSTSTSTSTKTTTTTTTTTILSSTPSSTLSYDSQSVRLPKLDEQSEQAALALVSSQTAQLSRERHAHLLCALAALASGNPVLVPDPSIPRAEDASPRVGGRPLGAPPDPPLRFFDPLLMVRLAIGFFVFTTGASPLRIALFFVGGIVYYLVEIGLLSIIVKRFLARWGASVHRPGLPPYQRLRLHQQFPFLLREALALMLTTGFRIPTTPGLLADLWSIFIAAFMSLIPSWKLEAAAAPAAPDAPAAPAARA